MLPGFTKCTRCGAYLDKQAREKYDEICTNCSQILEWNHYEKWKRDILNETYDGEWDNAIRAIED